jgi:WD40 repeat protein
MQVWDSKTGQNTITINGNDPNGGISWSPDSRYFVTSGDGDNPTVWDSENGSELNVHSGTQAFGRYPAVWSPVGHSIVDDGEIWDGLTNKTVRIMDDYDQYGQTGAEEWAPNGGQIISSANGSLVMWDANTGATIWTQELSVSLLSWAPDGKYIAWSDSGMGGVINAQSGASVGSFQITSGANIDALSWSPSGQFIATAGGGVIQLWAAPR